MTERLALPRRYRDQIESLLSEHVPGVEVWAYGSRVNGRSHEGSDLDLVLRGPDLQRIDSGQLMDLTEALEESNVPIIVQTHDWARLPERFHREIEREYVVLVEKKGWKTVTLGDYIVANDAAYSSLNSTRKCNRLGSWHRNGQLVYFPGPFQTQLPTEALMGTYYQLTEHQRYQIYALKKAGHNQQCIAATLAVSPSTICRELRRNQGQRGYRPGQAHQKALARRCTKAKATKMTPAVIERIEADLRQEWSPEQIAGRLAATDGLELSPQRIYQHIQADRQAGGTLYRHLRHGQKQRKKRYGKADGRGQIKDRVSIDQRPAIVEEKSRIGDWEIDLVMGRPRTGALVSVVERRSRYTLLGKVGSKQADQVAATTIALLAPHKEHTQTITADNGKEFAHHATISEALDAAVYFAHPYHAWERGLNENTNGLIRQYVPKGTALDTLSEAQIHHIMDRLNHRPRKGLAFQTPHEILCKETGVQPKHGEIALTS